MWAFITALSLCIYAGFYTFQKHVIVIFWSKSQLKRSLKTCREYQICGGLVWFGSGSGTLAIWRTHLHRCKERPTEIPTGGVFDWGFYGCFTSMKILQKIWWDHLGRWAYNFFAGLCEQSDEIVPRIKLDLGVFTPKRNLVTKFVGPGQSCRKGKSSWKQRNCACHRA